MPTIDVFKNDAFSLAEMTQAISDAPYKPGRLGEMGLFDDEPLTTTTVQIESDGATLALLPTKARGEPATLARKDKRRVRSLVIPHIPYDDIIRPDEIQNIRAFGSEDELETVAGVVQRRLNTMRQRHEVTLEHLRIGAVKGIVLDADGATVLLNLFTEFGITQPTATFALGTATDDPAGPCMDVLNAIEDGAGDLPYDHVHAVVGRAFFKKFITHPKVKEAYAIWENGRRLQTDNRYGGFEYGGIIWEQYRGRLGGTPFVPDGDAQFFPAGAPGLFKNYHAPGDMISTANTVAELVYARQEPLPMDKGIHIHTESNPLPICLKPAVLVKGTSSN